jgi:hypothetical protein
MTRVSRLFLWTVAMSAAGAPGSPPAAAFGWPREPVTNTPVCAAPGSQSQPAIVPDGAGGAIVAWQDARSGHTLDIYAQHVDADGVLLWPAGGVVISEREGDQLSPQMAPDGNGGALIAWLDYHPDRFTNVFVQRVSAAGAALWQSGGLPLCATPVGDLESPQVIGDGTGGAILAWLSRRPSGGADIRAERVSAMGTPRWPDEGARVCAAPGERSDPRLATDGAGGAILAWQDYRFARPARLLPGTSAYSLEPGSVSEIYAQRVDSSGAPRWLEGGMSVSGRRIPMRSGVLVADGDGGVVVVWRQDPQEGPGTPAQPVGRGSPDIQRYSGIAAQGIDREGALEWGTDVVVCDTVGNQVSPLAVADGEGGAIVVWRDAGGFDSGLYAQRIDSRGARRWGWRATVCLDCAPRGLHSLVSDGAGGVIVAWSDRRQRLALGSGIAVQWADSAEAADIYTQRIDAAGKPMWAPDGVPVCTSERNQESPAVAADGSGGAIVVWTDGRMGNRQRDIYGQHLRPRSGGLGMREPLPDFTPTRLPDVYGMGSGKPPR